MNKLSTKNHYKLYKSGKQWITALVIATTLGITAVTTTAHAKDNPATTNEQSELVKSVPTKTDDVSKPNNLVYQTENSTDQSSMTKKDVKNEEQSAKVTTTFDNDQQLHKLFTSDTDINTVKQLLGPATIFHIFSDQTEISADTNGNIATKALLNGPEFGTRGESQNHTTRDVYYIGSIAQIGANAFRTGNNYVVLGDDSNVKFNGDQVFINGNRLDHLKKADVHVIKGYLDIDNELDSLRNTSGILASLPNDSKVIVDFGDMNNRFIDISQVDQGTDNLVIINIDASLLEQSQPITIKGLSSNRDGAAVILNVRGAKETINWQTQTKLVYDDGTQVGPGESHNKPNHVLWNFGNATQYININSGYLMGSVLAPNSEITANVNADGNLIGKKVNIKGGESHRWDFWAPEFVTPVFPHGNNDFVYSPHNGQSTTPKHKIPKHKIPTQGKSTTPGKATTPIKPTTPGKATTPIKPTTPGKATTPGKPTTPGKATTPGKPTTPGKATTPGKPTTPGKATTPVKPTTPGKATTPVKPTTPGKATTPVKPTTPGKATTPVKPTTPGKATTPVQPTDPSKPTSPVQPSTPVVSTTPKTSIPVVPTTPKTSTPKVPTPQPSNPTVTTPKTSTPAVPTPQPSNPTVTTPKTSTPAVPTPQPSNPTVTTPKTSTPKVPTPQPSNPTVTTPKTSTPAVPTPQPSNPAVPTPPTTPVDPTTPDMPNTNTPKTPIVPSVLENKEQRKVNLTPGTSAVFETSNSGLPKTGSVQSKLSQITGLLLLAILATFGLYKKRV